MPNYELMLVVEPFLEDAEHQALIEKATDQIKRRAGNITQVDPWGKRRLAYPINKKMEGFYALISFDGEPTGADIAEIERVLRLDEKVMRVMVTRIPVIKPRRNKSKVADAEAIRAAADTMSAGAAGQQPQGR